jgi:hypothetical protein
MKLVSWLLSERRLLAAGGDDPLISVVATKAARYPSLTSRVEWECVALQLNA